MTIQYVSNVYTGSTGGSTPTPGTSSPTFTVNFAEVLQDETLVNTTGSLANQFKDRTSDVTFADPTAAARQGVTLNEQTVANSTRTFTSMDDLRAYMSTLMGDLKRKEVMAQHSAPETDLHKISPLLQMTLLSAQEDDTKTAVLGFLNGQDAPQTVHTQVTDETSSASISGSDTDTTPGAIPGGITVTFTEALQTQTLVKATGTLADQFKDRTSDVTYTDAADAAQHGVAMTEQSVATSTRTFANTDDLKAYMSALMGDLKRKEVMAQHASPETDARKISPVLRVTYANSSKTEVQDQVTAFLASDQAPKLVRTLIDDSSGASSDPGDTTPGKIKGGITVTFTQVLQQQTLRDVNGPLADQFKDRTSDVTFADATEAAQHGVAMTEQVIGTSTKTFATTQQLHDYMSTMMGDLKRKEVMEQHASPETDTSKLSPLLRVTLADSSSTDAKDQVTAYLASADAPKTVRALVESTSSTSTDSGDTDTTPGKIAGGITVAFTEVLQTQTLVKATGPLADQFKDRTSDITFATAAEAAAQGVNMTEQTIGTSVKTFATTDDLRDYMSTLMGDLKRKEVMEQHASPETDMRKISPVLFVTLPTSASATAKDQVTAFLASDAAPKTVRTLVDDGSGTATDPGTVDSAPGKIAGGITVTFTQSLQDQTLRDKTGALAAQFKDRTSDVTFADSAAAAAQGVTMTEQTLGTTTLTFASTDDLRDYISGLIGNLKRKEVMEQSALPETDTHKISPLLRVTLSSSASADARTQVVSFLGTENSLHVVPLLVDDGIA